MHAVVRAAISASAQFFEKPLCRAAFSLRQFGFRLQDKRQHLDPVAELWRRLNAPRVIELGLVAPNDLADGLARHRKRAHDLLDRPLLCSKYARLISPILSTPIIPVSLSRPIVAKGKDADIQRQKGVVIGREIRPSGGHYCKRIYSCMSITAPNFAAAPLSGAAKRRHEDFSGGHVERHIYGGHIERLIGTQMGGVHFLPGSTSSNIAERGEYDPKLHAALTLRDVERYIALEIVGSYHQSIYSGLCRPPIAVWREREGDIPLRLPHDRMRFWLTFLPEEERTLRPDVNGGAIPGR